MKKEPIVTVSTVTAFVAAVIGLFMAFGLDLSDAQRASIMSVVSVVAPIVVIAARHFAWSENSVLDVVDDLLGDESLTGPQDDGK